VLNIVIPMAGAGRRFKEKQYSQPKPLIKINGVPMIEVVINNLKPNQDHKFIFICQKKHILNTDLEKIIKNVTQNYEIIPVENVTDGPASSVLLAKNFIDNQNPLMIANCDQYIEEDINLYLSNAESYDGYIMTMKANEPKWSYIQFDNKKNIQKVVEKKVVSNVATVGIYNFRHGNLFCKYSEKMIADDIRVNNEFYVAPVYNYLIEDNKTIDLHDISGKMFGLGTPEDLDFFLELNNYK
jgi:NDP-sugar pyrophosphorylase family protein